MTKKTIQPTERDFQTWIKKNWSGWLTQLHPGLGSDTGIPDLLLGASTGLVPAELKIGSVDEDGVLWCSVIRPSQIRWHSDLADAGFGSVLLIGVWEADRWRVFVVDGALGTEHSAGYKVGTVAIELSTKDLAGSLDDFLERDWW